MSKPRNIADLGSHDVLETSSTGVTVTGTVSASDFAGGSDSLQNVDASKLDGQVPSFYLDFTNFTNVPTLYSSSDFDVDFSNKTTDGLTEGSTNLYHTNARVDARIGDGTLTVSGGSGLTGSGTFNANQTANTSFTIDHADTSSQSSVNNSGSTVIQDVTTLRIRRRSVTAHSLSLVALVLRALVPSMRMLPRIIALRLITKTRRRKVQ